MVHINHAFMLLRFPMVHSGFRGIMVQLENTGCHLWQFNLKHTGVIKIIIRIMIIATANFVV